MCILIITIDASVINFMQFTCFSNCGSNVVDTVNPADASTDNLNECCNTASTNSGYGENTALCITACKFCYNHFISLHIPASYIPT